ARACSLALGRRGRRAQTGRRLGGRLGRGRLGGLAAAARRAELGVEPQRAHAVLRTGPVGAADHVLVGFEAFLLDRDRVGQRRIDVAAREGRRAHRVAVDDHLGARGRRRNLQDVIAAGGFGGRLGRGFARRLGGGSGG